MPSFKPMAGSYSTQAPAITDLVRRMLPRSSPSSETVVEGKPGRTLITPQYSAGLLGSGVEPPYVGMRPKGRVSTPVGGDPLGASTATTGQIHEILTNGVPEKNGVPEQVVLPKTLEDAREAYAEVHRMLKPPYQKRFQALMDNLDDQKWLSNPKNLRAAQLEFSDIISNGKNFMGKYFPKGVKASGKTALILGFAAFATALVMGAMKGKEQEQQGQMRQMVDLERSQLAGMSPEAGGMERVLPFLEQQNMMLTQGISGGQYPPQAPVNAQVLKMLMQAQAGGGQQP